jgi:hypothetical protein
MTDSNNPVVEVAKQQQQSSDDGTVTLSTGVRVRFVPVSAKTITEVTAKLKYPPVPKWFNERRGVEEENPNDPVYLQDRAQVDQERGNTAMDAMAMFGVELVDDVPEDNGWVKRLHLIGIVFNADDPIEREFYYKKHVAMGNDDWGLLASASGISEEDIAQAEQSFQRDAG